MPWEDEREKGMEEKEIEERLTRVYGRKLTPNEKVKNLRLSK